MKNFGSKITKRKEKFYILPVMGQAGQVGAATQKIKKFMLEYSPIIEFLENGGKITNERDEIIQQFENDCQEKFGEVPYLGGAYQLKVAEVAGLVKINEYDGNESIEEFGDGEFL